MRGGEDVKNVRANNSAGIWETAHRTCSPETLNFQRQSPQEVSPVGEITAQNIPGSCGCFSRTDTNRGQIPFVSL